MRQVEYACNKNNAMQQKKERKVSSPLPLGLNSYVWHNFEAKEEAKDEREEAKNEWEEVKEEESEGKVKWTMNENELRGNAFE